MEQLGAGSRTEGVEALPESALELIGTHLGLDAYLERGRKVLRTDFVVPMTSSTTPTGTRTNAVHQTAKPTLIATTPLTSQRHATSTASTYGMSQERLEFVG